MTIGQLNKLFLTQLEMKHSKNLPKAEKDEILDQISDELEVMSMNDFSNLVEKYDLGIEEIDQIFWSLREKLYEERKNK
mgnify:CR=1 FL=1